MERGFIHYIQSVYSNNIIYLVSSFIFLNFNVHFIKDRNIELYLLLYLIIVNSIFLYRLTKINLFGSILLVPYLIILPVIKNIEDLNAFFFFSIVLIYFIDFLSYSTLWWQNFKSILLVTASYFISYLYSEISIAAFSFIGIIILFFFLTTSLHRLFVDSHSKCNLCHVDLATKIYGICTMMGLVAISLYHGTNQIAVLLPDLRVFPYGLVLVFCLLTFIILIKSKILILYGIVIVMTPLFLQIESNLKLLVSLLYVYILLFLCYSYRIKFKKYYLRYNAIPLILTIAILIYAYDAIQSVWLTVVSMYLVLNVKVLRSVIIPLFSSKSFEAFVNKNSENEVNVIESIMLNSKKVSILFLYAYEESKCIVIEKHSTLNHYLFLGWRFSFSVHPLLNEEYFQNINKFANFSKPLFCHLMKPFKSNVILSKYFAEEWYRSKYGVPNEHSCFSHYISNFSYLSYNTSPFVDRARVLYDFNLNPKTEILEFLLLNNLLSISPTGEQIYVPKITSNPAGESPYLMNF